LTNYKLNLSEIRKIPQEASMLKNRRNPPRNISWQNPKQLLELKQQAKRLASGKRIEILQAMLDESFQLRNCTEIVRAANQIECDIFDSMPQIPLRNILGGY